MTDSEMYAPVELTVLIQDLLKNANDAASLRLAGESTQTQLAASLASLARLKALNRQNGVETRRARQVAADAKQRMDAAQLGLQNLLYERQYLEREIRKCEEYQSEYQNVALEDEASFRAANVEQTYSDEHELTLARLKHELAQRQLLESQKKELLSRKTKLTKDNEIKKAKLDELEKLLDGFLDSAKTIQSQMQAF